MDTKPQFVTKHECEQHREKQADLDNKQCTDIIVLKASYKTVANLLKVEIGIMSAGFLGIITTILAIVLH